MAMMAMMLKGWWWTPCREAWRMSTTSCVDSVRWHSSVWGRRVHSPRRGICVFPLGIPLVTLLGLLKYRGQIKNPESHMHERVEFLVGDYKPQYHYWGKNHCLAASRNCYPCSVVCCTMLHCRYAGNAP